MTKLAFDIETIPDVDAGRRLYNLDGLSDEDVARAMVTRRVQKTGGNEFLPLHLHRIVAISVVMRHAQTDVKVFSFGDEGSSEAELIGAFYREIEEHAPTLISWNGGGFDLPVLHYRALVHGVRAARYWDVSTQDFRYNNYLSRFHWRHIDLMDVLAGYNLRAAAPLAEIAQMLGFPGKLGMDGGDVWPAYCDGAIRRIRDYCETDALNTYLIYLQWEKLRGRLDDDSFARECDLLRAHLQRAKSPHLDEFLAAWRA